MSLSLGGGLNQEVFLSYVFARAICLGQGRVEPSRPLAPVGQIVASSSKRDRDWELFTEFQYLEYSRQPHIPSPCPTWICGRVPHLKDEETKAQDQTGLASSGPRPYLPCPRSRSLHLTTCCLCQGPPEIRDCSGPSVLILGGKEDAG